jgi:transposase-like protein
MAGFPRYTAEFKKDAVELVWRTGKAIPGVARDLGLLNVN